MERWRFSSSIVLIIKSKSKHYNFEFEFPICFSISGDGQRKPCSSSVSSWRLQPRGSRSGLPLHRAKCSRKNPIKRCSRQSRYRQHFTYFGQKIDSSNLFRRDLYFCSDRNIAFEIATYFWWYIKMKWNIIKVWANS